MSIPGTFTEFRKNGGRRVEGEVACAKVLVGKVLDLLQNPELVRQVKGCFKEERKPYVNKTVRFE